MSAPSSDNQYINITNSITNSDTSLYFKLIERKKSIDNDILFNKIYNPLFKYYYIILVKKISLGNDFIFNYYYLNCTNSLFNLEARLIKIKDYTKSDIPDLQSSNELTSEEILKYLRKIQNFYKIEYKQDQSIDISTNNSLKCTWIIQSTIALDSNESGYSSEVLYLNI